MVSLCKSSEPFSPLTGSLQHLTGLTTPSSLSRTSLAVSPPTSVASSGVLCRLLHSPVQWGFSGSCPGLPGGARPRSWLCLFAKEVRVDFQPQHPPWASEPVLPPLGAHAPLTAQGAPAVLCEPASFGYLLWPQDHSGAKTETCLSSLLSPFAPRIQSLKTVKFASLISLD